MYLVSGLKLQIINQPGAAQAGSGQNNLWLLHRGGKRQTVLMADIHIIRLKTGGGQLRFGLKLQRAIVVIARLDLLFQLL